jgi:ligand-binding sensor domain-containing protein
MVTFMRQDHPSYFLLNLIRYISVICFLNASILVIETTDGSLLIGCNRGVFYYDENKKRESPYKKEFDEVRVDDIKQVGNKLLFATKGKGILFVVNDSVITVDETKGLASNLVGRMTVSGNEVWVATNKGVSHLAIR